MTTIQGVKSIEAGALRSFRISLDSKYTNGHDFCELIIDETNKNFTARLWGGEVYTYGWGAPGDDFVSFLINVFREQSDYLFNKIADYSKSSMVDMEKTVIAMKKILLNARRNHELSDDTAREAYDIIHDWSDEEISESHFYDTYSELSDNYKASEFEDVFSNEPWCEDFVQYAEDWKARVFCEKVAPILAEVLKQEYGKK